MDNSMANLYIKEMRPGVYLLDENHDATGYLVVGEDRACLIDTMNGVTDLGAAVRKITDKPVMLINTHGHPDHIYGNVYFDNAHINLKDLEIAESFIGEPAMVKRCEEQNFVFPVFEDIHEGAIIKLGGKTLRVYDLPGHTPGGIVLLLEEERILFTGDSINHHLWMQLEHSCPMETLVKNLDRLMFLEKEADVILHGHAHDFDDISLMRCLRDGAQEICDGKTANDSDYQYFGGAARQHSFECLPGRKYQQADHVIVYTDPL